MASARALRTPDKPTVLIIGGGYAGVSVAKKLDKSFFVILVDRKEYFLHNIGSVRACVEPGFENNLFIPYSKVLKYGEFIQGTVNQVNASEVFLDGMEEPLHFDFLICATGSHHSFPGKATTRKAVDCAGGFREVQANIRKAAKILVVGGGPFGTEMAAEIASHYPEKTVTLVHAALELIGGNYKPELKAAALASLQKRKVNVVLGEKLVTEDIVLKDGLDYLNETDQRYVTDKGTAIVADIVFFCTGFIPRTKVFLKLMIDSMNSRGLLMANDHLQVRGYSNVFAVGDCASIESQKHAFAAMEQAKTVAKNIKLLCNTPGAQLFKYTPRPPTIFLSLGKEAGVSQVPQNNGMVFGNSFTKYTKSRDMWAKSAWNFMNQKFPQGMPWGVTRKSNKKTDSANMKARRMSTFMDISDEAAKELLRRRDSIEIKVN